MKRLFLSFAAALLTFSISLHAQRGAGSSLGIEVGDVYDFETVKQTMVEARDPVTDSLRTMSKELVALSSMEVREITTESITWKMSMVVQQSSEEAEPNSALGGRAIPMELVMITDRNGRFREMKMESETDGAPGTELISAMVNSAGGGSEEETGLFMQPDLQNRKVGEQWNTSALDTTTMTIMAGISLDMISRTRRTFIYEGAVDTLDVSAARLRWTVDTLEVWGSFAVPNTEMTITIEGEGTGAGLAYYSLADGILLYKTDDMTLEQNVEMGAMGAQSMTMRTHSEELRQH